MRIYYDGGDIDKIVAFYDPDIDKDAFWVTGQGMTMTNTATGSFVAGVDHRHHKIVANAITEMTAPEKAARPINCETPAWCDWTPAWTNLTIGNATVDGKYKQIGKVVHYRLQVTLGNTSTVDGAGVDFTLPVPAIAELLEAPRGCGWCRDEGTANYGVIPVVVDTTKNRIYVLQTTATYLHTANISATIPFTWTTTDKIMVEGTYEAA